MRPSSRSRKPEPSARASGRRRPRLGWLLPLVALGIVGFLYYRPLTSYVDTRAQLDARQAEVVRLRAEKRSVDARLERAGSLEVLARDARRIGYIAPGEQLFIVKGIDAWRRAHRAAP